MSSQVIAARSLSTMDTDILPEDATVFLPVEMQQLVDIGLATTQAHADTLVLGGCPRIELFEK